MGTFAAGVRGGLLTGDFVGLNVIAHGDFLSL